ncbi:flagellar protein FlgN [Paenibacillus senegalensis]|uniref:flagellar protein FlgN n=1 Tax=Paenibacillus senegalensis TaxID=1465766 RepID=UPI000289392A|nr:flagellar protein FlgN [Paenibacillus senegalensis]
MSIPQLINILDQLTEVHHQLLESGEQKKQAIIDNDVKQINQLVTAEGKRIKQVADLEQERIELCKQFLIAKGYRPSLRITVAELSKLIFNADEKKALLDAQHRLVDVMQQVKLVNESNQQLIKQALQFIEFSIDVMAGPGQDEWMYKHPGHAPASARTGMFDTRA